MSVRVIFAKIADVGGYGGAVTTPQQRNPATATGFAVRRVAKATSKNYHRRLCLR